MPTLRKGTSRLKVKSPVAKATWGSRCNTRKKKGLKNTAPPIPAAIAIIEIRTPTGNMKQYSIILILLI
ncbi:MAG: hypothetical protein K8R11_03015 [Methanococcoides sp.]|nr:hypothetical protein [Methanococcoides sp.]